MMENKGRRPLYETPEALQAGVDRYFESCKGKPVFDRRGYPVMKKNGRQKMDGETPPTLSGLSKYLGFTDRHTFTRQKKRGPEFAEVVMLARLRVEMYCEECLFDPDSYKGAAFALALAFGWKPLEEEGKRKYPEVRIINRAPKIKGATRGTGSKCAPVQDLD